MFPKFLSFALLTIAMIPTLVLMTDKTLTQQAAKGKRITRPLTAKVMANNTKQLLSNPLVCATSLVEAEQILDKPRSIF